MAATSAPAPAAQGRLGRFELRRVLGQGAQATVWLAFDPRLEREVAVKLLRDAEDAAAIGDWLHEARNVSRLTHPHVVPVFEADVQDGKPYMVFEYVPGPTLTEHLRRHGAMRPRAAVQMMLGVLDALQAAHAAGLVHRDLKPSNILVDASGRARVMDFGIAARVQDGSSADRRVVGTPGYMSPEAARGEVPVPAMDVFAAGLVLAEMLAAAPVLRERDPYYAIHRVITEDLMLPASLPPEVDETLRALLRRAIERDLGQRLPSAAAFHAALTRWLNPEPVATAGNSAASNKGALDFLLRRMRTKTDFPAMSESVGRIQRVASSDRESVGSLSNEILKDVALTNKLLRLVNTAQFSHAGGGSVSTVSRAVSLVGFAGIRNMALSLVLLEHMNDKTHAQQLRQEFLRSLMAGAIAGELCAVAREGEEAFLGAMFQNLGRLLTQFYFPDEAMQIRELVQAPGGGKPAGETQAAVSILGLSFEELGLGVAKSWGLPDTLQRCMARPAGEPPVRPVEKDRLRWVTAAANDVADALLNSEPNLAQKRVGEVAERYARALGVSVKELQSATERARDRLVQTASAMQLHVPSGAPARRLLDAPPDGALTQTLTLATPSPLELQPTLVLAEPATLPGKATDVLAAGIQDITNSMVADNFRLNDVLRMILEIMFRALGFRRVVFCLRDPKCDCLTGRFGLGERIEEVVPTFRIPLRSADPAAADLFAALCLKGADTLIADAGAANIAARLPAWFRQSVNAPAFLLLPLMIKGSPFGLIYADKALPGSIELGEKELSMLRTLRNQAVMAFRQAGG